MSPEKPKTPPEKFVAFNGVRKQPSAAPIIRAMAWVDGLLTMRRLAFSRPPSAISPKRKPSNGTTPLQFIRRFARKELH